jgi:cytochrome oxidase Cu insertion factor (SCO1/SenC/PrrC family)
VDVSHLEPADRDPKKLRATAIKLVIFMIVSGVVLSFSYRRYQENTSDSRRPSFETRVTEPEVELLTADGKSRNLQDLKGNVTLVLTLPKTPNAGSQPSLDALRAVMDEFKVTPQKPKVLVFVLDGSNSNPEEMADVLAEYGEEPEVLRVVADEDAKTSLRSFTKTKMRFNRIPTERNGVFDYDTRLVLLDQNMFIRGIPGLTEGWDFETVAEMERKYEEAKRDSPQKDLMPPLMTTPKLQEILIDSIKYLYENPNEKGQE